MDADRQQGAIKTLKVFTAIADIKNGGIRA
jgi:hypothetical protein